MSAKKTRGGVPARDACSGYALMVTGRATTENDLLVDADTGQWVQVLEVGAWGWLKVRSLAGSEHYKLRVGQTCYPADLDIYGAVIKLSGMRRALRLLIDGDAWSLSGFSIGPFFETVHASALQRLAEDARAWGLDLLELETCYQGKGLDLHQPFSLSEPAARRSPPAARSIDEVRDLAARSAVVVRLKSASINGRALTEEELDRDAVDMQRKMERRRRRLRGLGGPTG